MVKSMPEANIAAINSPEHGAQQECRSIFSHDQGALIFLVSVHWA